MRRWWTAKDRQAVVEHYRLLGRERALRFLAELAARLGRTRDEVHATARRLGLARRRPRLADCAARLRRLAPRHTRREVARKLGVTTRTLFNWYAALGLSGPTAAETSRRKLPGRLARFGVRCLGELADVERRLDAALAGWPAAGTPLRAKVMEAVAAGDGRPLTQADIQAALGRPPGYDASLGARLLALTALGLLARRRVRGAAFGYTLAPGVAKHQTARGARAGTRRAS
jgi:hypothetical protein